MSLEGVLSDSENVKILYFKETISLHETEKEKWEESVIYKFYFDVEESCTIRIFLPFSIERFEWRQMNMRNKDYQMKVVYAMDFEAVEKDIFRIGFYEDLPNIRVFIPTDEQMAKIASATTKRHTYSSSTEIRMDLEDLGLEKTYFRDKKCGFGIMFKVGTRQLLSEEDAGKISKEGEIWKLNVHLYPIGPTFTPQQQNILIPIENADIWVIFPKNATPYTIQPEPKRVMTMEEEDEVEQEKYAHISDFKTYTKGQVATLWSFSDIRKEKSILCLAESLKEAEYTDLEETRYRFMTIVAFILGTASLIFLALSSQQVLPFLEARFISIISLLMIVILLTTLFRGLKG